MSVKAPAVDWRKTILSLSERPSHHARFLNSLSLLEYIGARKIMKSQDESKITPQLLAHMAEEIRHAQILKNLALRMSKGLLTHYSEEHTLCKKSATAYIQNIDWDVAVIFPIPNPWANYLGTTLLIEERANQIYPFYEEVLTELGFKGFLKKIFLEERSHLDTVKNLLAEEKGFSEENWKVLRQKESLYFANFMEDVAHSLET